jgi:uncharacterized protein (DUF2336 family)
MGEQNSNLSDLLNSTLADRRLAERARIMGHLADLFLSQPASYSPEQVDLFDHVMMRMINFVDEAVRAHLAKRLAPIDNAPRNVIRNLAQDDAIVVAGPILCRSNCLDEEFLVESARSKSQDHLMAISTRRDLDHRVTDVLVERGNDEVVLTLAKNNDAKLSHHGYSVMVDRAKDSRPLASCIWNRPEIPRQHLLALFEQASEAVRCELELSGKHRMQEIAAAVGMSSRHIRKETLEKSHAYLEARSRIKALQATGGLAESHIVEFAKQGQFEEIVVALAEMGSLPADVTERALYDKGDDSLFVLAKAIGFSWSCVRLLLLMKLQSPMSSGELERCRESYQKLPREVAIKGLRFHQLREQARSGSVPKR